VPLHQELIKKTKSQLVALGSKISDLTEFARESPIVSGAAIGGTVLGGGLLIAQQIKRRSTKRISTRARRKSRSRSRVHIHRHKHVHRPRRHKVRRVHKHRVKRGLDIIHRGKKRGISLKAIRASIASPKTPEPLKRGLRKLLRKRSR